MKILQNFGINSEFHHYDARRICENNDATFPVPSSDEENEHIAQLLPGKKFYILYLYTLVCLNSGMASVTKFLKFPIFRKIDVFRNPKIPDF